MSQCVMREECQHQSFNYNFLVTKSHLKFYEQESDILVNFSYFLSDPLCHFNLYFNKKEQEDKKMERLNTIK